MSEPKTEFWHRYSQYCLQDKVCPSKCIMRHFNGSELCLPVEAVRSDHWHYLLSALSADNCITKVHFASCVSPNEDEKRKNLKRNKRSKEFPIPYGRSQQNIRNISVALARMLRASQALAILKLENLHISCFVAKQLAIGLVESCYLKLLSFSGCKFEPGAIKIICGGLVRSCVTWLDLSSCAFDSDDIEHVCDVIKAHGIRRRNLMFPQTLRYNFANLDEMHGINRLSLNFNYIDLDEIVIILECLEDDLWVKALDFQNCGIDNAGAKALLELASVNPTLEVIDLRLNNIDESLLQRLDEQLNLNKAGKNLTCTLSPIWKPSEMIRKYNAIGKGKLSKKAPVYKIKIQKKSSKSHNHSVRSSSTIHRKSLEDVSVQTPIEMLNEIPEKVQDLVNNLRIMIHNEKKARHYYETRCKRLEKENYLLKQCLQSQSDDIYIDQDTYFDIKHTFEKLKIFFDVMKKYGLWEYISMLGFDEATDVILKESDSLKSVKILKKDTSTCIDDIEENKIIEESCCNCRKTGSKHSCDVTPDDAQDCATKPNVKKVHDKNKTVKTEDPVNDHHDAYKYLQELKNDYNNSILHHVYSNITTKHEKVTNTANVPQDNAKPSSSKLLSAAEVSKAAAGAQSLIKKFSYANMPKQLKELVTPGDFYSILKKELERCGKEVRKTLASSQKDNSSQTSSHIPQTKVCTEKSPPNWAEVNTVQHEEESLKLASEATNEEDYENITISELIARERAAKQKQASPKLTSSKKDSAKSSVSSAVSSRIQKNINHAKNKGKKSIQVVPKSKNSSSSQTSCKIIPANASSDEINSSDSVVTASDKVSSPSSASSSSSSISSSHVKTSSSHVKTSSSRVKTSSSHVKTSSSHVKTSSSNVKTSSSHNDSDDLKSYIESVSDASTFKDVESISDTEIVSQVLSQSVDKKESDPKTKSASSLKITKVESLSSQSSTLKSKNNKPVEAAKSGSSSIKNASNKSDKSAKTNISSQAKTKAANKPQNKNRPKNNSSKSSSVPSLSDITTVSSKSLNTDSVMKQITGSDDNSKGEN